MDDFLPEPVTPAALRSALVRFAARRGGGGGGGGGWAQQQHVIDSRYAAVRGIIAAALHPTTRGDGYSANASLPPPPHPTPPTHPPTLQTGSKTLIDSVPWLNSKNAPNLIIRSQNPNVLFV